MDWHSHNYKKSNILREHGILLSHIEPEHIFMISISFFHSLSMISTYQEIYRFSNSISYILTETLDHSKEIICDHEGGFLVLSPKI